MPDPAFALAVFAIFSCLLAILFWPRHGLVWRIEGMFVDSERVDVEDALKHLYDYEYSGSKATVDSVAGCLSISQSRAVELIGRLQSLGLVEVGDHSLVLTATGRSSALRVIRIHRLWEKYLAEHTGVDETQWHHVAERWEHTTSPEDADALAARLANPRFDPHGDPIPLPNGEMPAASGVNLTTVSAGQSARIVHVEDEPDAIYAQLIAVGLHIGMIVRVNESTASRVRIEFEGEECVLAPIVVSNVTVVVLPKQSAQTKPFERLADLKPPMRAKVVGFSPACRGPQTRRLLDLGFVEGTIVEAELVSPVGEPIAFRVRGALIALRRDQARMVYVNSNIEKVAS